jgi:hypothetical protein
MDRKIGLFIVGLIVALMCVNVVSAVPLTNRPNVYLMITDALGNEMSDYSTIPLNAEGDVTRGYVNTNPAIAATVTVSVSRGPSADGPWTNEETLWGPGIMLSGEEVTLPDPYKFEYVGYYNFTIVGETPGAGTKSKSDIYTVTAGPVLSEPATIAALGISMAVIGVLLVRKKSSKQ